MPPHSAIVHICCARDGICKFFSVASDAPTLFLFFSLGCLMPPHSAPHSTWEHMRLQASPASWPPPGLRRRQVHKQHTPATQHTHMIAISTLSRPSKHLRPPHKPKKGLVRIQSMVCMTATQNIICALRNQWLLKHHDCHRADQNASALGLHACSIERK